MLSLFFLFERDKEREIKRRRKQERERERERERHLFAVPLILKQSLVDSCMCPNWGSNLQPWLTRMTLQPTELPGQGLILLFFVKIAGVKSPLVGVSKHPIFLLCYSWEQRLSRGNIRLCLLQAGSVLFHLCILCA